MIFLTGLLTAAALEAVEMFSAGALLAVTVYSTAKTGRPNRGVSRKRPSKRNVDHTSR